MEHVQQPELKLDGWMDGVYRRHSAIANVLLLTRKDGPETWHKIFYPQGRGWLRRFGNTRNRERSWLKYDKPIEAFAEPGLMPRKGVLCL